ncbi:MAG: hydroxymethylbilane synthase [Gammaproteobacteria bacterium]|nr:hydroxymethylbilane synthase [Gammaproteobacteria bacterium]
MEKTLKIATRESPLALWQAEHVKFLLEKNHPTLKVELLKMTTKGDQILNSPLAKIGGKGLFIKELEIGMLEGRAHIAVHSMKDVPYELPKEFEIGAILERENPFDAFVSNNFETFDELPEGSRVGTCSQRRIVQIKNKRPDIEILDLRGNVNTRLRKLDDGDFDAIILACAGLIRLDMSDRIKQELGDGFFIPAVAGLIRLDMSDRIKQELGDGFFIPAVGQGAVGIEVTKGDEWVKELIEPLIHSETTQRVIAERSMNESLEGGCSVPIGGFSELENGELTLTGLVGDINTGDIIKESLTAPQDQAYDLGKSVADLLVSKGAKELLESHE